ncbi:MAG: hypothetical protein IPM74_01025 [Crocinitomicaceae bacterium]|nr:hypothetical protein [Crocinitomicaceae bacterium]MBK8924500.1 hypothetical protein [Crocinitomicaceae bacterium]
MKYLNDIFKFALIASLTLGLAPFNPPHIIGKLQWLAGGGAFSGEQPMQADDWFDLFLHGTPWLVMIVSGLIILFTKLKSNQPGIQR